MIQLVKLSHIDINVVLEGLRLVALDKRQTRATRQAAKVLSTYIESHHVLDQFKGKLPK